jgi:hypothetical protein
MKAAMLSSRLVEIIEGHAEDFQHAAEAGPAR